MHPNALKNHPNNFFWWFVWLWQNLPNWDFAKLSSMIKKWLTWFFMHLGAFISLFWDFQNFDQNFNNGEKILTMVKKFWQWRDYFDKCRWISDFSDPSDQNFVPWLVPSKTWLLLCQKVRFWVGPFKNVAFLVPEWLQSHCFITPLSKKKQKRRDSLTVFDRVFCVKISIHHNKVAFLLSSEVMWNGLVLAFVYSFGISEWMNITGTIIGTNAASIGNSVLRKGTVLIAKAACPLSVTVGDRYVLLSISSREICPSAEVILELLQHDKYFHDATIRL